MFLCKNRSSRESSWPCIYHFSAISKVKRQFQHISLSDIHTHTKTNRHNLLNANFVMSHILSIDLDQTLNVLNFINISTLHVHVIIPTHKTPQTVQTTGEKI